VKTNIRAVMIGAENIANFSGDSLAIVFGDISPKIRRTIVSATVETVVARLSLVTPSLVKRVMKKIVASEDARMFTMLLPISTVESIASKLSASLRTLRAFLLPSSAAVFRRILLIDRNAVSVAEKYALAIMHKKITTNSPILRPSMMMC
jgi:hypothetical protein